MIFFFGFIHIFLMLACMLLTNLIRFVEALPFLILQDSTNPVGQTEKTTAGEA